MSGNKNKNIIYGWITKQEPLVIVIGYDEEKIRKCEGQAEAQAGRGVIFFKYSWICVSFPNKSFKEYTKEHGNQIIRFVRLMGKGGNLSDCVFNDGEAKVVEEV